MSEYKLPGPDNWNCCVIEIDGKTYWNSIGFAKSCWKNPDIIQYAMNRMRPDGYFKVTFNGDQYIVSKTKEDTTKTYSELFYRC